MPEITDSTFTEDPETREGWIQGYAKRKDNLDGEHLSMEDARKIHQLCSDLEKEISKSWLGIFKTGKTMKLNTLKEFLKSCTVDQMKVSDAYETTIGRNSQKEKEICKGWVSGSRKLNVEKKWNTSRTEDLLIDIKNKYLNKSRDIDKAFYNGLMSINPHNE